jgi:hypothetical protein
MDELGLYYQIDGNIGLVNIAEREYIIKDYTQFKKFLNKNYKTNILNIIILDNQRAYTFFKKYYIQLKHIKYLEIYKSYAFNQNNKCNRLNVYYMTGLKYLKINAKLTNISPKIKNLVNLRKLDLSNNSLVKLPNEICRLNELLLLDITLNKLTYLPPNISELNNLKQLNMDYNDFKDINIKINNKNCFKNLVHLSISHNKLNHIPQFIFELTNLQELNLSNNNINYIDDQISNLINLKSLHLDINNIFFINESLFNLTNLVELNLGNNSITDIPITINKLVNLKELCLEHNLIFNIDNIYNVVSLERLYLNLNLFKEINNDINRLINLKYFSFANNNIEYVSSNILDIPGLTNIFINDTVQLRLRIDDRMAAYLDNGVRYNNIIALINDEENVHNIYIQESLRLSIENLLKDDYNIRYSELIMEIIDINMFEEHEFDLFINDLMLDYKFVYDYTNMDNKKTNYYTIFIKIWGRIKTNEHKIELYKRLYEEIIDGLDLCFVGKITRLINSLCGYYDDISLNISDNETIGNIIVNHLKGRELNIILKEELNKILIDRGFPIELINNWLNI